MLKQLWILICLSLGLGMMMPLGEVSAQDGPARPPAILRFEVDSMPAPTVADVEAGTATAILRWEVANHTNCCLTLEFLQFGDWVPLPYDFVYPESFNQGIPAKAELEVPLFHPYSFGPISYRLSIQNTTHTKVFDQRIVEIPFAADDTLTPSILHFNLTTASTIASTTQFDVALEWAVQDRQPFTNVEFLQVAADGSTTYIELPREHLWIASSGMGTVRPNYPSRGGNVTIRMQVVDVRTGDVIEALDQTIAAPTRPTGSSGSGIGPITPTPTPPPTNTSANATAPQLNFFTVTPNPINRAQPVQISWSVSNAQSVTLTTMFMDYNINMLNRSEEIGATLPTNGQISYSVPHNYFHKNYIFFRLTVLGNDGASYTFDTAQLNFACFATIQGQPTSGIGCEVLPVVTTGATFETFENGYVITRHDTGQAYALWYGEQINGGRSFDGPLDAETITKLGPSTSSPQTYAMRAQMQLGGAESATGNLTYFTFPDGSMIKLYHSTPMWHFLE